MQQWWSEISAFCLALVPRTTAGITGSAVAAVITVILALGHQLPEWGVYMLVGLAFFAAAFSAWRDERRSTKAALIGLETERAASKAAAIQRTRQEVLEKAADYIRAKMSDRPDSMLLHALPALLVADADKFNTEEDVVWVCNELVRAGFPHPFKFYIESAISKVHQGEWLEFLRAVRLARGKEAVATAIHWFSETLWKERTKLT